MAIWRTIVRSSPDVSLPFPAPATLSSAAWDAMPVPLRTAPKAQIRHDAAVVVIAIAPQWADMDRPAPAVKKTIIRLEDTVQRWTVQPYSPALYEQERFNTQQPQAFTIKRQVRPEIDTIWRFAIQPYSPALYEQNRDSIQTQLKKLSPTQIPPVDDYGNHFTPFVPIPTVSAYEMQPKPYPPQFPKLEVDRIPPPDTGVTFTPYKPTVPWEAPIDKPTSRRAAQPVRQEDVFVSSTVIFTMPLEVTLRPITTQHVAVRPEVDQQFPASTRDYGWSATFVVPKLPVNIKRNSVEDVYVRPPQPGNTPDYGWTPMRGPSYLSRATPELKFYGDAIFTRTPATGRLVIQMVPAENRTIKILAESRTLTIPSENT